jgi:3-hydroxybutyryl-CoA dehydrogenase
MDLVGLDLIETIHQYLLPSLAANRQPGQLLKSMVQKSQLGMKTGSGFYDWKERDPAALIEARDKQIVREVKRLRKKGRQQAAKADPHR